MLFVGPRAERKQAMAESLNRRRRLYLSAVDSIRREREAPY
jgi:hypothetical protein